MYINQLGRQAGLQIGRYIHGFVCLLCVCVGEITSDGISGWMAWYVLYVPTCTYAR